jgi:hypothetical protein
MIGVKPDSLREEISFVRGAALSHLPLDDLLQIAG